MTPRTPTFLPRCHRHGLVVLNLNSHIRISRWDFRFISFLSPPAVMEAQMVRIDRTSSIEREPRTLRIHQIQSARDLAIYVLSTNSIEEASRIFTEGLKPVESGACRMGSSGEEILDMELLKDAGFRVRDIASAPF